MIVNKKIADDTLNAFRDLYLLKYPIEKMELIDNYNANDDKELRILDLLLINLGLLLRFAKLHSIVRTQCL